MSFVDRSDQILACAAYIVINKLSKRQRRRPRYWQRRIFQSRIQYSGTNLLADLRLEDASGFRNFCRLSPTDFEYLLTLIGPIISKRDTNYRDAVPPHERLAVTLRFLATGDSYTSLMYLFKISKQLISRIVPEVCNALITMLGEYVKVK